MKNLHVILAVIAVNMFGALRPAFADTPQDYQSLQPILDQITTGLFQHVETITEFTTKGETNLELLATPFQIGRVGGGYLLGVDAGVLGDVAPSSSESTLNWTAGIHLHLTPLLKRYIFKEISPDYPALAGLELNPRFSILFEDGHKIGTFGFGVGWAFGPTPLQ